MRDHPAKGHYCRPHARLPIGSARTLHQSDKMRFEETAAPLPTKHLITLTTYLTTYPWVSMGVPEGLTAYASLDYESEGRRFESCRAHYKMPANAVFSPSGIDPGVIPYHTFDHLTFSQGLRWALSP
jgi:hypothetical protein